MNTLKPTGQKTKLLNYLRNHGSITQYEAMTKLGIGRLSERIRELERSGIQFKRTQHGGHNNTVIGQYVRYWLVEEGKA